MAVERYRALEDMPSSSNARPGPAESLERMVGLTALGSARRPPLFEAGVYRFRSVREAHEAREQATFERMRALRRARAEVDEG